MSDIQIRKYQGAFVVYNKNTGKRIGRPIYSLEDAQNARDFQDKTSDTYEGGESMDYGKSVGGSLTYSPSKQPVKNAGKVDSKPENASKVTTSIPEGTKMKQKGSPTRSYGVSAIDKARSKIGGR